MNSYTLDWKQYSALARQTVAEGCVLLCNERASLPLASGDTVAVFGRIQLNYYKSGTGSGGMVNVPYVHSILDGLREYEKNNIHIYEPLLSVYQNWVEDHPFDRGNGWGQEPWSQEEMPLDDTLVQEAAAKASAAIVVIGRTAGEDRDNSAIPGSYYLTDAELAMLKKVCAAFPRTTVVLNTGNIISMNWVEDVNPGAVLYAWQGGMEGGCGVADVLCGAVSPSGKLSDTIARDLADYPSTRNFGSESANYYQEDIYVGYRYFETFALEKVLYPFGFGLSYTNFETSCSFKVYWKDAKTCLNGQAEPASGESASADFVTIDPSSADPAAACPVSAVSADPAAAASTDSRFFTIRAAVKNTGSRPGKETVQVYANPPQGKLGKPLRNLCAFAKTKELLPGESETLIINVPTDRLASYDDSGATGHKSCYVLEEGMYEIYAGANVRDASLVGNFSFDQSIVVAQCQEAMAPVKPFERFRPQSVTKPLSYSETDPATNDSSSTISETVHTANGSSSAIPGTVSATDSSSSAVRDGSGTSSCPAASEYSQSHTICALTYEPVPLRTVSPAQRRLDNLPDCLPCTGDQGYRLRDVMDAKVSMEEFLAQLSDEDLMTLSRGEGMCSPKVTPGTAAAFGGITESLKNFDIPAGCCSDGPSGIRMDCGTSAFSLPNGTLLACTFNTSLVTELFAMEGLELYANKIDALLGPGINIHRSPLNGRNFEYHSEDPYLTGCMAVAQVTGMDRYSASGTMKHFCANNQEYHRHLADGIISERALREIYLKPFEMGVRCGHTRSIMTTYGPVNGIWTAGNYDLNTTILRGEWHYQGLVMTDWWTRINDEGEKATRDNLAAMVRAQNDIYMVTQDALTYQDTQPQALKKGTLTRAELVRNAANICRFLMASPAMQRLCGTYRDVTHINTPADLNLINGDEMEYFSIGTDTTIPLAGQCPEAGSAFTFAADFKQEGLFDFTLTAASHGSELAQMSATLTLDNTVLNVYTWHGESEKSELTAKKEVRGKMHYLKFYVAQSGLELESLRIRLVRAIERK
ncbi:MAG: glycoside hydrolase family 3 C-terminal domain-containing protein [Clostridiales bacterium]|nr:glycoside hydrolase family 3 C-terminal domain-containing protein [Clostridiales bacterium]